MKLLLLLLGVTIPAWGQAQTNTLGQAHTNFTPISNLNQPNGSGGDVGIFSGRMYAISFTTSNTLTALSSISLSMIASNSGSSTNGGVPFTVALYGDAGGSPGNVLTILSGNNYPNATAIYTYTNTSPLLLMSNTTYWIVGSSSTSISAEYKWDLTSETTLNPGSVWTLGALDRNNNGTGWSIWSGYYLEFSVTVTTNLPMQPFIASAPMASTIIYSQTLANSILSGGSATNAAGVAVTGTFAFSTPATVPPLGTTSESVIFTPMDSIDYYAATTSVPVTAVVNLAATLSVSSLPTASTISYGQTLASSLLSGGAATNSAGAAVAGSFAFTTPTTVPGIGTTNESVTFTPTDNTDYITALISVPVTVLPFTFTNANAGLIITAYDGSGGVVTIPDTINALPVIGIGTNAFSHSSVTSVTISTNVTSIGASAFAGCLGLTNVTIPDSVTNIGIGAFNVCDGLTSVNIPNNLTTIQPAVFAECTKLASVTIPDNVTSVGEGAFDNCYTLTNVLIGSGVTNIGIQAFSATDILAITVDPNNTAFCSVAGVLFDKAMTTLIQFPCGWAGNYTIPSGISSIGYESFADCGNVTGVILPDTVTNIDSYAFILCTSLTSITIPIGVNTIPEYTFAEDTSLTNVTISGGVTSLGSQASANTVQANSLAAHPNVTSLGSFVFSDCTGLTSIYFNGNAPAVDGSDFGSDSLATAYYLPGTTGWAAFTATTGVPAVPWNPQAQIGNGNFGVQSNKFGFDIAGGSNLVVVVVASTNLANPVWLPISTNTLSTFIGTHGLSHFSDPFWTNSPSRYYGFRFP